jgi:hypothetical protein
VVMVAAAATAAAQPRPGRCSRKSPCLPGQGNWSGGTFLYATREISRSGLSRMAKVGNLFGNFRLRSERVEDP